MDPSTHQSFTPPEVPDVVGDATVREPLDALVASLGAAVRSFWGLDAVLVRGARPLVLSLHRVPAAEPDPASARTSLRLPLPSLVPGSEAGSHLVVYACVPGALVDLAADATYVLGPDGIVLDVDLPPGDREPGVRALAELAVVERAHGVLIGQGHPPEDVEELLRRRASAAGVDPYVVAVAVLASVRPERPSGSG